MVKESHDHCYHDHPEYVGWRECCVCGDVIPDQWAKDRT